MIVDGKGKVEPRVLVTGGTQGQNWVVESGLQAGDRVIVQGIDKVRPGMTVKAAEAQLPAAAAGASGAAPAGGSPAQAAAASAAASGAAPSSAAAASSAQ